MRDLGLDTRRGVATGAADVPTPGLEVTAQLVLEWAGLLGRAPGPTTDPQRIDLTRAIEVLKSAGEGRQAEIAVEFDRSQRQVAADAGVATDRQGLGIASQIALARRVSPWRGQRLVQLAKVARRETPCSYSAFRAGRINERRLTIVVQETACLSLADRLRIDEEIAGDPSVVEAMGDRELASAVRRRAYALDPQSYVERRAYAETQRRTSVRPAPDVMAWFTALLPVKAAVQVHAVLHQEAVRRNLAGDPRSHGQLMADILVERVVGPTHDQAPLMVNVVVPDSVLLGDDDGAAHVDGFGEIPGHLLREWVAAACDDDVDVFLRRLYSTPGGALVAMDSRSDRFEGKLAEFLRIRDQRCRRPYCGAPIRHLDHSVKKAHGGPTDAEHGQGLCEACNYSKEGVGWSARPRPGPRHTIETVTPTGHRYTSVAPRQGRATIA